LNSGKIFWIAILGGFVLSAPDLTDKNKRVGTRETLKALEKGEVDKVFVALDAEKHVIMPVINSCMEKNIPIEEIDSMAELGKMCGVEVMTATAACLKE
jgi:large subunit ribosomal protein L7A